LRFYEDKGLIAPKRQGQQRLYTARDRARVKLILRGKRVGFSLAEIRDMLDLYDRRDGQRAQMELSLKKFRERMVALQHQRQDIDEALKELDEGCQWIEQRLAVKAAEEAENEGPRFDLIGYGLVRSDE
jgi:DNA-binding transcriptional MerR regulator